MTSNFEWQITLRIAALSYSSVTVCV